MSVGELSSKSIIIAGFGIEGQSTYAYLRRRFPAHALAIADRREFSQCEISADVRSMIERDPHVRLFFGPDYLDRACEYDLAIKSAGIPFDHPGIRAFEAAGGIVTSHLEIFFGVFDRNRIVGITGTKGKSTTATLLHHIGRNAGLDVRLAGNIGRPPLSLIEDAGGKTLFVLELSSYQLDRFSYSPHMAVLLNIVPEHIGLHEPSSEAAHHRNFEDYVSAKENITRGQGAGDILIFNPAHEIPREIGLRSRARALHFSAEGPVSHGCYVTGEGIFYSDGSKQHHVANLADISLLGKFNRENVLAAITAASLLKAPAAAIQSALRTFKPLPHRIEFVGEHGGIRFYDDSIATVAQATLNALDGLGMDVQTLIAGGHDRNLKYEELAKEVAQSGIKNLILFEPTGRQIWDAVLKALQAPAEAAAIKAFWPQSMEEAVRIAYKVTEPGKICLLSPASSSYGMFKNFVERGDVFKACVKELAGER